MRRALILVLLAIMLFPYSSVAQLHDYEAWQTVVVTSASSLREQPSTTSDRVISVLEGDLLRIIDGTPSQGEGLTWWKVRMVEGADTGWLPDSVFTAQGSAADSASSTKVSGTGDFDRCWGIGDLTVRDGVSNWSVPPAMVIDPAAAYLLTLSTTAGDIAIALDAEHAPIATNNVLCLAHAGYYDGTEFHRISADFMIQGGDPTGTGRGTPGYVVPSDPTTGQYPIGSVALANAQPDQNGSQFFITVDDLTGKIPDDYPVFGQVVSGIDTVIEISRGEVEPNERGEVSHPVDPVMIESVDIGDANQEIGPPLRPFTPTPTPEATATAVITPTVAIAPTVAMPPTTSEVIELEAKDIAFVPTVITISPAGPVILRMTNTGAALHNFSIDALDIDVDVNPGETVDIIIPAGTSPGIYDFYCNVPGHKEAGMVGTLVVQSPSVAERGACTGLDEYIEAYDEAIDRALAAHAEAVAIILSYGDSQDWWAKLDNSELLAVEHLFTDLAAMLNTVDPPTYAQAWQQAQHDAFVLLADMLEDAQTVGIDQAQLNSLAEVAALESQFEAALDAPAPCPAFVAWATEESVTS